MKERLKYYKTTEIGNQYQRLNIVDIKYCENYYGKDTKNEYVAVCKCECGKICTPVLSDVKSGNTKSCGCLSLDIRKQACQKQKQKAKKRFDYKLKKLGMKRLSPYKGNKIPVQVKCFCDKDFYISWNRIQTNNTKSCGNCNNPKLGDKFNKLTITKITSNKSAGCSIECKCECGNIWHGNFYKVKSGNTKSCGHCCDPKPGEKYGSLLVIESIKHKTGNGCTTYCLCDCGKLRIDSGWVIRNRLTCKYCSPTRLYTHQEVYDKLYNKGFILTENYIDSITPVKIKCHCGNIWKVAPSNIWSDHTKSCGCSFDTAYDHMIKFSEIKFDLKLKELNMKRIGPFNGVMKEVKVQCQCKNIFHTQACNILYGDTTTCNNCPHRFLSNSHPQIAVDWDYDVNNTTPNKVKYGTENKYWFICKKHGSYLMRPMNRIRGENCPKCRASKGERKILEILTKLKIPFEIEKKFKKNEFWNGQQIKKSCKNKGLLRFDFAIEKYNLVIEFQGKGHYYPLNCYGKTKKERLITLKNVQLRDEIKQNYCNNITLLEIPYWKYNNMEKLISDKIKEIEKSDQRTTK